MRAIQLALQRIRRHDPITSLTSAGNRYRLSCLDHVLPHQVILRVGNNDISVAIDAQMFGPVKIRLDIARLDQSPNLPGRIHDT